MTIYVHTHTERAWKPWINNSTSSLLNVKLFIIVQWLGNDVRECLEFTS